MNEGLSVSNKDLERHIGGIGMGGQGRSNAVEVGNAAVSVLKTALSKGGVAEDLRAPIIGHFCNEWNAAIESGTVRL